MEFLLVLLGVAVLVAPLVLSIVALVRANRAHREMARLTEEVRHLRAPSEPRADPGSAPVPAAQDTRAAPPPPPPSRPPLPAFRPPAKKEGAKRDLEVALGGKVSAFVGIAALVLGVAFFVGYAIRHGWIGPGMRIVLGLLTGGILIALGHVAEMRGRHLQVLARVLTGGGAALLFFSVYAAHGFYELISAVAAGAGLAATALAVFGLSIVYRSQIVALLGVLGAFLTPLAIGGDLDRGIFPLAYIATVNATVMVLGVRRDWQSLYNVAFAFTAAYSALWLNRELDRHETDWRIGLAFCLVYFAEFTVLGLAKLSRERGERDQSLDLLRMLATSLLLLGAMYWVLDSEGLNAWIGGAFLLMAVIHIVIARLAWRWLPRFQNEILVLLAGAITFATLALPVQLDGIWVSLGWALEGVVLSWFSLRYDVRAFRRAGVLLGFLGLGKSLVYDALARVPDTELFVNARFAVSLLSTLLLGVQARLYARKRERAPDNGTAFEDALLIAASIGLVLAFVTDGILVFEPRHPWAWLPAVIALPVAAAVLLIVGERTGSTVVPNFGAFLLALVPVALVQCVFGIGWTIYDAETAHFFNVFFLLALLLLGITAWVAARFPGPEGVAFPREATLNVLCVLALVFVVTREIGRAETPWKDSTITLWWGACALILILLGLKLGKRYLRHTALGLFGLTIGKVFLVDLAGSSGLIRVAAFVGVGMLLLVLSFTYQRLAPRFADASASAPEKEKSDAG